MTDKLHVVTGAFGISGGYFASRLLYRGHTVRTLSNSPDRKNALDGNRPIRPASRGEIP